MTNRSDLLLIRSKPKADESFMGYIIRLTEQNGYPSPSWIIQKAELNYGINHGCSFVYKLPEPLKAMSNLTGANITELTSITYCCPSEYKYCLFYGSTIHQSCIRLGYPKICPRCLSESPHCRRIWELSAVTTCLKHRCLLIDECPNCTRRISWSRNRVSFCLCEFDWREAKAVPVGEREIALTQHLHRLCGLLNGNQSVKDPFQHSPILDFSLQDFLSALFFFAGVYKGISASTGIHLIPKGKNKDIHALFTSAYYIFEDWPKSFYQFLDWWRTQQRKSAPTILRLKSVLYRDFGKLYIGLYKTLLGRQYDFIRNAFINYLVERWEGCEIPPFTRKKSIKHASTIKYISKSDAKLLLNIDELLITQLIETGRIRTMIRSKGVMYQK